MNDTDRVTVTGQYGIITIRSRGGCVTTQPIRGLIENLKEGYRSDLITLLAVKNNDKIGTDNSPEAYLASLISYAIRNDEEMVITENNFYILKKGTIEQPKQFQIMNCNVDLKNMIMIIALRNVLIIEYGSPSKVGCTIQGSKFSEIFDIWQSCFSSAANGYEMYLEPTNAGTATAGW
jgi:hypothetical protein